MARLARKPSESGIYHVIMRGVNHQNIYDDSEDYYKFISFLDRFRFRYDDKGIPCGTNCTYYAYCLMSNHCHLLIQQEEESVGETIKRISVAYAYYYNNKYGRDGHLFMERFRSEPVNDLTYFNTLLRYIHQNPVKGGIVKRVDQYEYSSWGEYTSEIPTVLQICNRHDIT